MYCVFQEPGMVVKTRGIKGSRNRWALLGTDPDMDDDDKIEPFEI